MANLKRIHVLITGRVQGVFYRRFTQLRAEQLGVFGWVRNLPDGRVEVVAEGNQLSVDKLLVMLSEGPPGAITEAVEVSEQQFSGDIDGFSVRPTE